MSDFSFIRPRLSPASPAWQNLSLPFSIQPYSRGAALVHMRLTEFPPVRVAPGPHVQTVSPLWAGKGMAWKCASEQVGRWGSCVRKL